MGVSRRRFLTTAAISAAVPIITRHGSGQPAPSTLPNRIFLSDSAEIHNLAARAVDAARSSGAQYADIRITRTRRQSFLSSFPIGEEEEFAIGVRALVNGYWGFYSSNLWSADEAVRLAKGAVNQAIANNAGKTRTVDLGEIPVVRDGDWMMPVKYDPFEVPIGEKLDIMRSAMDYAKSHIVGIGGSFNMSFIRQQKVFASTEGSTWQQTTYTSTADFVLTYRSQYSLGVNAGSTSSDIMLPTGRGWEHISESRLRELIPYLIDEAEQKRHVRPVDVGRYEAVFSPYAVASLINSTLGRATQLSRAMGFEANVSGTSYLNDPLQMLGELQAASPALTLTADRRDSDGAATVKWDDDGIEPKPFTIIDKGVLTDFQTTREQASWIAPWYDRQGTQVRSNGCAHSSSALYSPTQKMPNLTMTSDPQGRTFDGMVSDVKNGIAVMSLSPNTDQQVLNGIGRGSFREIVNGKLGKYIQGASILFRSPETWRSLKEVGRQSEARSFGFEAREGHPMQITHNTVTAAPARFADISVIDTNRRA